MSVVNPRSAPNGSLAQVELPRGMTIQDLSPGQKIVIKVNGIAKKAVVDVMVAAVWGGPQRAFETWDRFQHLHHVQIKIVWEAGGGNWNESRELREATHEEFLEWRAQFNGLEAPTPMP